jgi:excisionase family DNA binding protein
MMTTATPKPLISVAQAAAHLGRATATVYEWARRGELPGLVTINGRYYVRRSVLEGWLSGETVNTVDGGVR